MSEDSDQKSEIAEKLRELQDVDREEIKEGISLPRLLILHIKNEIKDMQLPRDPSSAFYLGAKITYDWMRKMYKGKIR